MGTGSGIKHDKNKPDCSLLLDFSNALMGVSAVGTFGVEKYTRSGWKEVPNAKVRYLAAAFRHLFKHGMGENLDTESGLPHLAHAAWNILAALEMEWTWTGGEDV